MVNALTPARIWTIIVAVALLAVVLYVGLSRPEDTASQFGPVTLQDCQLLDDRTGVSFGLEVKNTTAEKAKYDVDVNVFYDSPGEAESQIGSQTFELGPVNPDVTTVVNGEIALSADAAVDTYGYKCAIVDVRER